MRALLLHREGQLYGVCHRLPRLAVGDLNGEAESVGPRGVVAVEEGVVEAAIGWATRPAQIVHAPLPVTEVHCVGAERGKSPAQRHEGDHARRVRAFQSQCQASRSCGYRVTSADAHGRGRGHGWRWLPGRAWRGFGSAGEQRHPCQDDGGTGPRRRRHAGTVVPLPSPTGPARDLRSCAVSWFRSVVRDEC